MPSYFPLTARIMPLIRSVKMPHHLPRTAHIMFPVRNLKMPSYFPLTARIMPPIRRVKMPSYFPLTARIMSHMGVKMPSARISTMTATMPIRMGSMRAVRLLRS